jgi:TRAP-type uncharacterized transport system substrate-binding protein
MSLLDDLKELPSALKASIREEFKSWWILITDSWHIMGLIFLVLFVLLWVVKPAPPHVVEFAAGMTTDYTYTMAREYVEFFKRNGIDLKLVPTEGTYENLKRVRDPHDSIRAAFVQSGITDSQESSQNILSLGSVDYEPIWLFYWGSEADDQKLAMAHLLEQPISIGNLGSGTHSKAVQLLEINGLSVGTNMLSLPEDEAVKAIKSGTIRAMLLVEHFESPIVQDLLHQKGLAVANFSRAGAYAKQLKYIEVLHVPEGGFSLSRDYPGKDIQLLSTTTNLVVDEDLHPAIQMLFMQASSAIAGRESFFSKEGEFPAIKDPSIPVSPVAQRYFDKGPPILHYILPFWMAEFIERIIILALPFFAMVYPIVKSVPGFLEKRAKKRILRFYGPLKQLEAEVVHDAHLDCIDSQLAALNEIESSVLKVKVHKKLVSDFYALRSDIDFVRTVLLRLKEQEKQS